MRDGRAQPVDRVARFSEAAVELSRPATRPTPGDLERVAELLRQGRDLVVGPGALGVFALVNEGEGGRLPAVTSPRPSSAARASAAARPRSARACSRVGELRRRPSGARPGGRPLVAVSSASASARSRARPPLRSRHQRVIRATSEARLRAVRARGRRRRRASASAQVGLGERPRARHQPCSAAQSAAQMAGRCGARGRSPRPCWPPRGRVAEPLDLAAALEGGAGPLGEGEEEVAVAGAQVSSSPASASRRARTRAPSRAGGSDAAAALLGDHQRLVDETPSRSSTGRADHSPAQTSSAASSVKPPAKTDRRRSRARSRSVSSRGSSRPRRAASLSAAGGARPPVNTGSDRTARRRSARPRHPHPGRGELDRERKPVQLAADRRHRGGVRRSRRSGRAPAARSTNSATASEAPTPRRCGSPGRWSGSESEGTRQSASPQRRAGRGSWPDHDLGGGAAAAPRRPRRTPREVLAVVEHDQRPARGEIGAGGLKLGHPRQRAYAQRFAIAAPTSRSSASGASSTHHAPSGKCRGSRRPAPQPRLAKPPAPVRVSSRVVVRAPPAARSAPARDRRSSTARD